MVLRENGGRGFGADWGYMYIGFGSGVWEIHIQGVCGIDPGAFIHREKETAKNFMRERYVYGIYPR